MSTTESELEVSDADIDAIEVEVGWSSQALDLVNKRNLIRAIVAHFRAKPAASAEPVAWMQEDGSLHTTHESAYFRGGKVTPLCPCSSAPQWLPIESAPKDGTEILLRSKKGRIANGCWDAVNSDKGFWAWALVMQEPTHWMPLTDGPKGEYS